MSKSKKNEVPDYNDMSRSELINETTRLALAVEEAETRGWETRRLVKLESYHLAMAELIAKSMQADPVDGGMLVADARKRAVQTRRWHMQQATAAQRERLGLVEEVVA